MAAAKTTASTATVETGETPTGLTFADAAIPTMTRKGAHNPFADVVADIAKTGQAKVARLAVTDPAKQAAQVRRQLQAAGLPHDVTVRSTIIVEGGALVVTFWTVPKITRKAAK